MTPPSVIQQLYPVSIATQLSSAGILPRDFLPTVSLGDGCQQQFWPWDFSPILMAPASSHRGHQWICDLVRGI